MQRRDFLRLLGLSPLVAIAPNVAIAATQALNGPQVAVDSAGYARLLILVELKGGNDGLNTVIPYAADAYRALRPRLAIPRDAVLQLDERTGLHPSLKELLPLWNDRQLAIVQGVGYPDPDLSHFRSIEIWDTASGSHEYLNEGWLSRLFAASPTPASFAADGVVVASPALGPLAGGARAIVIADTERFMREARLASDTEVRTRNPALAHILKVESDIRKAAARFHGDYAFRTDFPRHPFGRTVRTACQVVAADASVAVIRITHNGFDTHSGQLNTQARLLAELAEGMQVLRAALQEIGRWNSTLVMSYAEFGRRPRENLSGGTDHGTANAHFILGGRVRGGLYGAPPDLSSLQNDNLRYAVDFRSLYATAIERWWGLPSRNVLGGRFEPLSVLA